MPQINLGESIGQATPSLQRGVPSVAGLDTAANAMNGFLQAGANTALEFQKNRINMEAQKATTEAMKEIENKKLEFRNQDTDYTTQADRYNDFYTELEGRYQGQLTDPRAFAQFKSNVSPFAFQKGLDVKSNALQQDAVEQQSILGSTLDDISSLSLRGDQAQFEESAIKGQALIDDAHQIGVLDTQEKNNLSTKFANDLSRGKIRQEITLDPSQALDNIRSNKYAGLSAEEQSQFESMALSKLAQGKNRAGTEAKKQSNELVSDTILSYKNGYIVSDEESAAATVAAGLVGKQEDLIVARNAAKFATLPRSVRDGLPATLTGVHNAEQRVALEAANEAIERELDNDGYSFAVEQRVIEEAPIDINDPSSIQGRLDQMDYLKSHYGRDISPLTTGEADQLVQALPLMGPQSKTQLALTFGSSQAIWAQLDKQNAGLFAMTGAIGDPKVMENVFKGQQLQADKLVASVSSKDYLPAFNDHVDDIYVGSDRKQMLEASLAYYHATTKEESFDSNDFEEAIDAVSGGIGKINGFKLELPRGVVEDDFEDFIDDMTPETIRQFGGVWSMTDEQAVETIKDAHVISEGSNRYRVLKDGAQLMGENGEPFVFSFDQDAFNRDKLIRNSQRQARPRTRGNR